MSFDAWLTLGVIVLVFVALIRNLGPPDVLFVGATVILAVAGIITPTEAFAGFSNPGMITVAALFVVAAGLRETGVLEHIGQRILGRATTERGVLNRLAAIVIPMSAFLNNTPIVAMFMPVVLDWSRRHQVSASKLLIPLSYLTILGGTCTLIGTSTNLVVNGLMIEHGLPEMSLFELSAIGIPYAIVGIIYLQFAGPKLLPDRKELLEQLGEARREYLAEMLVQPSCRLVGQTIQEAGLRQLPGLFLIEIDRGGKVVAPVGPDDIIEPKDRLVFTGIVSSIVELEKIPGLIPAADPSYVVSPRRQRERQLCEAVISPNSALLGKTIREANFRALYGAAVVAVHRGGARVEKKIGDIQLRPGDTLLLQTTQHFLRARRNDPSFYLISDVPEWRPLRYDRTWIAGLLFVVLLVLMFTNYVSTVVAGVLVAVLMIAAGCIAAGEARRSIEWQVLITIAASFGVGQALENSGAATALSSAIVDVTQQWGPVAALAAIYLVCSGLNMAITNNASAILLFPLCLDIAQMMEVDSRPFLITLTFAASASFLSPIAYQTNLIVYGPGGYRFTDFFKIGAPLNLILWIVTIVLVPIFWSF